MNKYLSGCADGYDDVEDILIRSDVPISIDEFKNYILDPSIIVLDTQRNCTKNQLCNTSKRKLFFFRNWNENVRINQQLGIEFK